MTQNPQTIKFLSIYKNYLGRNGIKSDAELCQKVLKFNKTQFSQAKKGQKNIGDPTLHRFLKYFKLTEDCIFTNPTATILTSLHKENSGIIEFSTGELKKIVGKINVDGLTILILK